MNWQKKPLELISDYSKVEGYKIGVQMSIAFLYTNNAQVDFEIRNIIPSTLVPPKMKDSGINMTKHVQDLC